MQTARRSARLDLTPTDDTARTWTAPAPVAIAIRHVPATIDGRPVLAKITGPDTVAVWCRGAWCVVGVSTGRIIRAANGEPLRLQSNSFAIK